MTERAEQTAQPVKWPRHRGGGWYEVPRVKSSKPGDVLKLHGRQKALDHLKKIRVKAHKWTPADVRAAEAVEEAHRQERRTMVASMRLRNFTARQIAERLGVGLATVHRDLEQIRGQWREDQVQMIGERMIDHLQKLDQVEQDIWMALAETHQFEIQTTRRTRDGERVVDSELVKIPVDLRTKVLLWNQLRGVLTDRSKVLGYEDPGALKAVIKLDVGTGSAMVGEGGQEIGAVIQIGGGDDNYLRQMMLSQGVAAEDMDALTARARGHLSPVIDVEAKDA